MTTKTPRATVVLEWEQDGSKGVLVHADRYRNTWILPGGGLEHYQNGKLELPMAAAVRELGEETGLTVKAVRTLFSHPGAYRDHEVFLVEASGKLDKIRDSKEAPAFALCGPDFKPKLFLCEKGYSTSGLKISSSTKAIVKRYYEAIGGSSDSSFKVAIGTSALELVDGNIVAQDVDAVVNAANKHLANGSGVAGAIFEAAGERELTAACRKYGGCPVGEARITDGFKLKARHIIHAVGPRFSDHLPEDADALLANAYLSSLTLAVRHGLRSVAFPSISTGIYGFPVERAAPLAIKTVTEFLQKHPGLDLVRFVLKKETMPVYKAALQSYRT